MTTYHGKNGVIKAGANAIAEVTRFSINETVAVASDNVQGDTDDTHLVGRKAWTGTIDCRHFPADTNGQAVLLVGASITLEANAIGNTSGLEKLTGTCTVTSRDVTSDNEDVVSLQVQVTGNGALTHGTISS